MMLSRKQWAAIALTATGVVVALATSTLGWAHFQGRINALDVDLTRPHAYVATPALSRLPRDLIKAPIAREVLTEDLAFYYETQDDRLSLQGAIKRLAFEHNITLGDKLLELVLDEPAEVAFWADAKGAPRHWLLALTRGTLARTLQELATVATKDRQLTVIDNVRFNGTSVTVYALTLSSRRTLALASLGNRVVVLSDPGLLFDSERQIDPRSHEVIAKLLSGNGQDQSVYRRHFGLGESGNDHTLIADTRLLSLGYQHFFPGLQAVRFDLASGGKSLHTRLRVAQADTLPTAAAARSLWEAIPINPATCALLPLDWTRAKDVGLEAQRSAAPDQAAWATLADQLESPAAICWYANSQLHTPVFVARTKGKADINTALGAFDTWLMSARSEAVETTARPGTSRWTRELVAPWGPHRNNDGTTTYKPTLASHGRWLTFSPDDALVELALDAQARRYPSVADTLPTPSTAFAVVTPRDMADLAAREAFRVLPAQQEAPLRRAAEQHLTPRLAALRQLPPAQLVPRGKPDEHGWIAVDWIALTANPTGAAPSARNKE